MMNEQEMQMAENQADLIMDEVKKVSFELDLIDERVETFTATKRYYGRTIEEWANHFTVHMDMNATPIQVKAYATQLSAHLDEAYRNKAKTARKLAEYKAQYDVEKANLIEQHATNRTRKTIPAAETLDKVADSQLGVRKSMISQYENALNFWQDMIFKLHANLKVVNMLAMSNGTLAKIEGNF